MNHDHEMPEWKRWTAVLLLTAAIATLVLALHPPGPARASSDRDIRRVVVLHFDTTRALDIGAYGGLAATPNVDALAARGLRYTRSITPVPKTAPSVASFLTAKLPLRHGVHDVGLQLGEEMTTLPEVLRQHGFVTGGFVSNPVVDRLEGGPSQSAGFDQGFDEWLGLREVPETIRARDDNVTPRAVCRPLVDRALEFIDRHEDERFFLWMLHLDPHAPYAPPAPWDRMYLDHPDLVAADTTLTSRQIHPHAYVPGRTSSREYAARHLGEVSLTDHHVGRLLRRLEQLPGRTLVVVTADHGESLGDADYWFAHGANVRHPGINVPLIFACEGVVPVGDRDALVASVDVAPTILDLLGIPPGELAGDGRSLVPTFEGADPWPDRMVPIQASGGARWRGVRSRDYCLQSRFDTRSDQRVETLLYHVAVDPTEQVDVAAANPEQLRRHLRMEQEWFAGTPAEAPDLRDLEQMQRRLRSLGYAR